MKLKSLLALLLAIAIPTFADEAKKSLTHETLWLMKRVGAPAPSPDGKWVVFPVTEPSYDEKEQVADLWLVPGDGSAKPRRITSSKAGESDVAWSPDSRTIALTAKRDGDEQNQVYVLSIADGGEAQRITNLSTGARTPRFSPDGKSIAYTSAVYPGTADDDANKKLAKEEKDRKYKVRTYESFPIRAWDRWLDEKQVHLFVQPVDVTAKSKDVLGNTKLVAEKGFSGTGLGGESRENIPFAWSPDGKWLVFVATTGRNTAAYAEVASDMYRVSAGGGEPEKIAHAEGGYNDPQFSPDGATLYAKFNPNNGKVYNLDRLVAFDWPSMNNRRVLTAASDRNVDTYAISPDSKTVYFTAEDAGLVNIYAVPASGGETVLAVQPERGTYTDLALAEDAPLMVARWGSSVDPQEIVRIDPRAKQHRNLTDFNVALARSIDWQPPQHFWFTSSRGRRI
ncbi:MAG TPA: S9 family peptidase, partial [Thermoanaerobaculia bacterium]|nr:S9 family peptidase [Thermoanaerobaculia bacterium]